MKARQIFLAAVVALAMFPVVSGAHEVPGMTHSHAFQQTAYGEYRVGHTVNSSLGSITIWSPKTYTGYQAGDTVKFARPEPISRPPGSSAVIRQSQADPANVYGKRQPHQE